MKFGGRWGKKLHNFTPKVSRRIQRVLLTVRTNFHVKLSGWLTLHNATYDFKRIPAHLSEFTNNSRVYFHLSNEVVAQGVLLKFYLWGLRLWRNWKFATGRIVADWQSFELWKTDEILQRLFYFEVGIIVIEYCIWPLWLLVMMSLENYGRIICNFIW